MITACCVAVTSLLAPFVITSLTFNFVLMYLASTSPASTPSRTYLLQRYRWQVRLSTSGHSPNSAALQAVLPVDQGAPGTLEGASPPSPRAYCMYR